MLDALRQNASHWLLKVALGVIALVFIFTFQNMNAADPTQTAAATVNGDEIPIESFHRNYESQLEARRNQRLPDELQQRMIAGQVMDQLIESELLAQFAEEMDIRVSKEELVARITELPFLRD